MRLGFKEAKYVLISLFLLRACFLFGENEGKEKYLDFSNRDLIEVLTELADRWKFNFIADIPPTRIPKAKFSIDSYPEEVINLLVKCSGFVLERIGNTYFILPPGEANKRLKNPEMYVEKLGFRPVAETVELLKEYFHPRVKFWPITDYNLLLMYGFPEDLEEAKKKLCCLDSPRHSLRISLLFKEQGLPTNIASISLLTLDNCTTSIRFQPGLDSIWGFSGTIRSQVSDEGIVQLKTDLKFFQKRENFSLPILETIPVKFNEPFESSFSIGSKTILVQLSANIASHEWILPENKTVLASTTIDTKTQPPPFRAREKRENTLRVTDPSIIYNLTMMDAPFADVLEKIASITQVGLICSTEVSGKVTVVCRCETYYEELMNCVCRAKGFAIRKIGNQYVTAPPNQIREVFEFRECFRLQNNEAQQTARLINDIFSAFQIEGRAFPDQTGNNFLLQGGIPAFEAAGKLSYFLNMPLPCFDIGVFQKTTFCTAETKTRIYGRNPIQISGSKNEGSFSFRFFPDFSFEDGVWGGKYWANVDSKKEGQITVESFGMISEKDRSPLFSMDDKPGLKIGIIGSMSRPWENYHHPISSNTVNPIVASSSKVDGFDKAFDSSF
ncbi:MAG: hypothetical protein WA705_05105 [Candidatus Ozemobacteraceae bacterium]